MNTNEHESSAPAQGALARGKTRNQTGARLFTGHAQNRVTSMRLPAS
ncbi:hypothetical protein [Nitrosomonas halophila]|nr:hypothetical protein [Nitrosomonas halophila]